MVGVIWKRTCYWGNRLFCHHSMAFLLKLLKSALLNAKSTAKLDDLVQDSGLDASKVSKMLEYLRNVRRFPTLWKIFEMFEDAQHVGRSSKCSKISKHLEDIRNARRSPTFWKIFIKLNFFRFFSNFYSFSKCVTRSECDSSWGASSLPPKENFRAFRFRCFTRGLNR